MRHAKGNWPRQLVATTAHTKRRSSLQRRELQHPIGSGRDLLDRADLCEHCLRRLCTKHHKKIKIQTWDKPALALDAQQHC